ncbi:MAG: hypothetical protein KDK41_10525 [Leptospiraceae bacterium]|nr:hypothetical protein [Leptospiraceae bacterium]
MKLLTFLFFTFFTYTAIFSSEPQKNLDSFPLLSRADIKTLDGVFFQDCQIIFIDDTYIKFNYNRQMEILPRKNIFIISIDEEVYSDIPDSLVKIAYWADPDDYNEYYADYIITDNYTHRYGLIQEITAENIRIFSVNKSYNFSIDSILEYRHHQKIITLNDKPIPPIFLMNSGEIPKEQINKSPINFIVSLSSPLNIFPQVNLGMESKSDLPIFFGFRAGGSTGPLITAGWIYGQVQAYLGIQTFSLGYLNSSLIIGYVYRHNFLNIPVSCECSRETPGYYNDFTESTFKNGKVYSAIRFWFKKIFFEIGWEFEHTYSVKINGPEILNGQPSETVQMKINEDLSRTASQSRVLSDFSVFHFSLGVRI